MAGAFFGKIFDFKDDNSRADKLSNDLYLEGLSKLLAGASARINSDDDYFFDDSYYLVHPKIEPNTSYSTFIKDFVNTFECEADGRIHIIRGRAGVGKTLFFNKGIQKLLKNNRPDEYVPLGVDFKHITPGKEIQFYSDYIINALNKNAIDAIRQLGIVLKNDCLTRYSQEYRKFNPVDDSHFNTPFALFFPVQFFCKEILRIYNKPCIIVFDNIDRACVDTQKNIFKATINICEQLKRFMKIHNCPRYAVYFAMRPETILAGSEARLGEAINFPMPNVLKISLKKIETALTIVAKELDQSGIPILKPGIDVYFYDILVKDHCKITCYTVVADYFVRLLRHYLCDVWESNDYVQKRLGSSEKFHCNISNYNVRSFCCFLAETISNGGFKPLTTAFNGSENGYFYTVYDYIEMIIRGRWVVHPGNRYLCGEGANKGPLLFNVFDTCQWLDHQNIQIRNFMIYIRILQYCYLKPEKTAKFGDLKNYLSQFFSEESLTNAVKLLVYDRLLYSYHQGDENISSLDEWEKVELHDETRLEILANGYIYLETLINEFEYIYQMALSSLMLKEDVDYLRQPANHPRWQSEKELTVLFFLRGMFEILKANINEWSEEAIESFAKIFYQNRGGCHPYRTMLNSFVSVMELKLQRAENLQTNSQDKLRKILIDARKLRETATNYFSIVLDSKLNKETEG